MAMVWGQNLVRNPSFESFHKCPTQLGNMTTDVLDWSVSTEGTTDYFNECSATMGVPKNFNGEQEAQFGVGYAGLYLFAPNDYREYLQVQLIEPLVKGQRYTISFYVSLAEKSRYGLRDIGVLFSEYKMEEPTKKPLTKPKDKGTFNYMEINGDEYFIDKSGWTLVKAKITAKGKETFLTIGNFRYDETTRRTRLRGNKAAAYYYVDMVSVTSAFQDSFKKVLDIDKVYVFKNILFKSDDFQLDHAARQELRELYAMLNGNTSLYVEIDAHTDIDGSPSYNGKLSANRALSVSKYLMSLGLSKNRITWMGHGDSRPIAENNTEEGKQKNRRVEFKVSKNRRIVIVSNAYVDE